MLPKKPARIEVDVIKAKIKKIKDNKNEDGRFKVRCLKSSGLIDGWIWCGMLVKDLYRNKEWYKIIPKLKPLYFAMHGGWNNTLQVEVWYKSKWNKIWSATNHFDSFAEDKKSSESYNNFIIDEGKKIAKFINENKSFKFIKSRLKKGHSGNTYGCSFHYGFSKSKNKEHMEKVKKEYNIDCGGTGKEKGAINPALLTIKG